uniref:ATP-dependent DNA helicase n=1 Tax=Brassica oleracea var. oleracea TaxID=109376 RepID=A0A0D3DIQ1_BRAOL
MRLLAGLTDDAAKELESFSNWILDIGDGKINLPNDGQVEIDIPSDLLIQNSGEDPIETMAREVYGQAFQTSTDKDLYRHRAILTPTNDEVDKINDYSSCLLLPHVIEGRIITGNNIDGDKVWIPRMFVTPPDTKFSFRMRRRQFPVTLAFAMTINKSQGQTPESVGLFLPRTVFSHGQLYVALSRVKSRSGLKILITGKEGKPQTKTLNVVYKQVFQIP